ncbi:2-oxoacid:acceptor oxidoreductase family protein [Anoxybacterium hadale]|uniref:2-oxoacid:acceptor oxidoreductase family protein n=1 Tax=Anoxybacterium hadale TaxID=3408580 RepID=UPI003B00C151
MRRDIRIVGAGGHGVISAAIILAKVYGINESCNVSQTQSYGPEARGGACKAEVVVSDHEEIDYMKVEKADIFIAFNQLGYEQYKKQTKKDGVVLVNSSLVTVDPEDAQKVYEIPASEIADTSFKPFAVNIVMLGALTKLLPKLQYQSTRDAIRGNFNKSAADMNLAAYDAGYHYIQNEYFLKKMA